MLARDPLVPRPVPLRGRGTAMAAVAGLTVLAAAVAAVTLLASAVPAVRAKPQGASGAVTVARAAMKTPAAAARVTSELGGPGPRSLDAWDRRALAAMPSALRARAARVLPQRPGSSGCVGGVGLKDSGQAWLTGFANVAKLHGAALVGPAFANLVLEKRVLACPSSFTVFSTEVPDFHGKPEFPPVRGTFLAFGFVPVTATIQISQVGAGVVKLVLADNVSAASPYVVQARARVNIKVLNVEVNGVSLPAGAACGTAEPGAANLSNVNPTGQPGRNFWDLFTGGPLSGTVRITHFSHCGVNGDNLDPILDASISGTQNFAKLIQGEPCVFDDLQSTACPPEVPKPRR